jgi:hypothetical protein
MRKFEFSRPTSPNGGASRRHGSRALAPPDYGLSAADRGASVAPKRKARLGAENDPSEREADHIANAVMRGELPGRISAGSSSGPQCAEAEPGTGSGNRSAFVTTMPSGPGAALTAHSKALFESRFGADFSNVRVHSSREAAASAEALQARAYTVGSDIVFGAAEYRPDTQEGQHLLAHELAHTLQQSTGSEPVIRRKLKVGAGLALDTKGFSTTKSGDVYSAPKALRKGSVWNEIFTSLLASPRTFEVDGTTTERVNSNLLAHMKARLGIIDFAAKKQFKFGAGAGNFKMNPDFWVVTSTSYYPKPGVDPMKAIEDINNPKNVGDPAKEYHIACQAATKLTMVGGSKSERIQNIPSSDKDDWVPGDWGYIKNVKFPASGGIPGLEGENIIYVGNDKFWGHFNPGLEYKTLAGWMKQVNDFKPPTEAELQSSRLITKVGLF